MIEPLDGLATVKEIKQWLTEHNVPFKNNYKKVELIALMNSEVERENHPADYKTDLVPAEPLDGLATVKEIKQWLTDFNVPFKKSYKKIELVALMNSEVARAALKTEQAKPILKPDQEVSKSVSKIEETQDANSKIDQEPAITKKDQESTGDDVKTKSDSKKEIEHASFEPEVKAPVISADLAPQSDSEPKSVSKIEETTPINKPADTVDNIDGDSEDVDDKVLAFLKSLNAEGINPDINDSEPKTEAPKPVKTEPEKAENETGFQKVNTAGSVAERVADSEKAKDVKPIVTIAPAPHASDRPVIKIAEPTHPVNKAATKLANKPAKPKKVRKYNFTPALIFLLGMMAIAVAAYFYLLH